MAYPRLDIVDTDETTVLFSFNDQTGTVNAGGFKTKLAAFDMTPVTDIDVFEHPEGAGGFVSRHRDAIRTARATFYTEGTSADVHATALNLANNYLGAGGTMIWQPTSTSPLRYIDFLPSPRFAYLRGQHEPDLARGLEAVAIEFLMQPYLRGAEVTTTAVTVPNDPATSTKVRVYPVTISGDLPTPASIRVQMPSGSAVERTFLASRPVSADDAADYLSDTGFFQCESTNRGWTITLSNGTSSVAGSNASGGNVARISGATSTIGQMVRRMRATRTTLLSSLDGTWEPVLRAKASASAVWEIQAFWGPSTADPAQFSNKVVTHDLEFLGGPFLFGYVELDLDRMSLKGGAAGVAGFALDIYARRVSGTGDLDLDFVWLAPADLRGEVVVTGSSVEVLQGLEGTTPPASIPQVWQPGTVVGEGIRLDAINEAVGHGPNTGTALPAGRHRYRLSTGSSLYLNADYRVQAVNVTDGTVTKSLDFDINTGGTDTILEFDAVAGKLYQVQWIALTGAEGFLQVGQVRHEFIAALGANESARSDAARYTTDRLDASGSVSGYLSNEGAVVGTLEPGLNHIYCRVLDVPLVSYQESQSVLARTPTVSVTYSPRYAL